LYVEIIHDFSPPKTLAPFLHLIAWKTKGKRGSIIHVGFQAYYLVMQTSHAARLEENNQCWVGIKKI
jgi:hypothetical protein